MPELAIAGIQNPGRLEAVKTTIDIPEETLKRTLQYTGAKTKKEAVLMALEEYNRQELVRELVASFGTWDIATNEEIEAGDTVEIEAQKAKKPRSSQTKA